MIIDFLVFDEHSTLHTKLHSQSILGIASTFKQFVFQTTNQHSISGLGMYTSLDDNWMNIQS